MTNPSQKPSPTSTADADLEYIKTWFKQHPILGVILIVVGISFLNSMFSGGENEEGQVTENLTNPNISEELPEPIKPEKEYVSISCSDFVDIFGMDSDLSDLRKNEEFKQYKNKYAQWSGTVEHIDELWGVLTVQVACNTSSFGSDTSISFSQDQKDKLLDYKEGDTIKFEGKLSDWGEILNTQLDNGIVIE